MTGEEGSQPCEHFTVLESRSATVSTCDVCDLREAAHPNPGRRVVSGGEIEALRRRMIVERYEAHEEQQRRVQSNGAKDPPA